jgi:hypothetical protein
MAPGVTFAAGGAAQRDSFGFAVHGFHSRPGDRTAASISVHAALKYELGLEEAAGDPRNSISPASRRTVQYALTASGLTQGPISRGPLVEATNGQFLPAQCQA